METLKNKLKTRQARVAVIGLGYVGLPLAVELAKAGFEVHGIDLSQEKVDSLKAGKSYIIDIKDEQISPIIDKYFLPTTDFSVLKDVDAISICVPTPLNKTKEPDVSYITAAVEKIVQYMKRNTLIVLESTTYPGTTEELVIRYIEEKNNFKIGEDFFVCFSPERVDPGNKHFNTKNTPKVIGGATSSCIEAGMLLYGSFIEKIVPVSSTQIAEMVKLLENTFRSINIALVNELTQMCNRMGINIWEVIEAASTKPFGYMPFYPGPGIGGHCIPLDPAYLSWKAKVYDHYNRFIELASDINGNMPKYVINEIADILNNIEKAIKGSKILLLGISYKKDIDDLRESPALEVFRLLEEKGAIVSYYDPYVKSFKNDSDIVYSGDLDQQTLGSADLVIITTDHSIIDYNYVVENSRIVYDTRNVTKNILSSKIVLLGGQKRTRL